MFVRLTAGLGVVLENSIANLDEFIPRVDSRAVPLFEYFAPTSVDEAFAIICDEDVAFFSNVSTKDHGISNLTELPVRQVVSLLSSGE